MDNKHANLKLIYENIALSKDDTTTASDFHLRDLEIELSLEYIRDGDTVLDVGCGPGVALTTYAARRKISAYGIDYAENMVNFAEQRRAEKFPQLDIHYKQASVMELPFEDASFNVVTSHRCLMALLDWEKQKLAIKEIHRVLKPGGTYAMQEGTFDGLERLNFYRRKFDLPEIEPDGKDRLHTLKFHEKSLMEFMSPFYEVIRTHRFGMYYFITRIIHPLFVTPDTPRYDHKLNEVATQIARLVPDFEAIGHLVGFILRKK